MIFCFEHAGDHGDLGTRGDKLAHQFTRQAAIQPGLNVDDTRATAFRSIGRDADHPDAALFRFVHERLKPLRVTGG